MQQESRPSRLDLEKEDVRIVRGAQNPATAGAAGGGGGGGDEGISDSEAEEGSSFVSVV